MADQSIGNNLAQADATVVDLYKMAVEMADRVSARRSTANAFFLTAQTTLVAVIGATSHSLLRATWWIALSVTIAGVVMSASWWLQLRTYRDLNRAKFEVINAIEGRLPVKIFSDEWAALKSQSARTWRMPYPELGTVERVIPGIFALLYVLLFLGRVLS